MQGTKTARTEAARGAPPPPPPSPTVAYVTRSRFVKIWLIGALYCCDDPNGGFPSPLLGMQFIVSQPRQAPHLGTSRTRHDQGGSIIVGIQSCGLDIMRPPLIGNVRKMLRFTYYLGLKAEFSIALHGVILQNPEIGSSPTARTPS